jgi:hypothetical protein
LGSEFPVADPRRRLSRVEFVGLQGDTSRPGPDRGGRDPVISGGASSALPERFWQKIDRSGDCYLWRGARDSRGWGNFRYEGRSKQVNRLIYEFYFGPIPTGLIPAPTYCLDRRCCRPEHLNLVTLAEWRRAQEGESRSRARPAPERRWTDADE